jgi:hypothetical protein
VNWRTLIVVVVLGVAIASAIRSLEGSPEAEFTAEEKAMLEKLEPLLESLVLRQEDLSSLPGHFEPCEGDDPYQLRYGSDGDSPDVEHIEVDRQSYEAPIGYSSFCDAETGSYVASLVALPYDKEHLLFLRAVDEELARAGEDALRELVDVNSDHLNSSEEVVDYRWVSAPTLGDSRDAFAQTIYSPDTDQLFEMYDFSLLRGVVIGGVGVELASHATAEEEALQVAQAFDDRIAAQLESLAAEVQAP